MYMEAVCTSKMLASIYNTTQRDSPADYNLRDRKGTHARMSVTATNIVTISFVISTCNITCYFSEYE
jgi:hypothetical protein